MTNIKLSILAGTARITIVVYRHDLHVAFRFCFTYCRRGAVGFCLLSPDFTSGASYYYRNFRVASASAAKAMPRSQNLTTTCGSLQPFR